jgi:hypothetical protein
LDIGCAGGFIAIFGPGNKLGPRLVRRIKMKLTRHRRGGCRSQHRHLLRLELS